MQRQRLAERLAYITEKLADTRHADVDRLDVLAVLLLREERGARDADPHGAACTQHAHRKQQLVPNVQVVKGAAQHDRVTLHRRRLHRLGSSSAQRHHLRLQRYGVQRGARHTIVRVQRRERGMVRGPRTQVTHASLRVGRVGQEVHGHIGA